MNHHPPSCRQSLLTLMSSFNPPAAILGLVIFAAAIVGSLTPIFHLVAADTVKENIIDVA